jgi:ribonucleoside-diphosphate reductase alpha chain
MAISASSDLAKERGSYASYEGSLWSQGILPLDSIEILEKQRGTDYIEVDKTTRLDWEA